MSNPLNFGPEELNGLHRLISCSCQPKVESSRTHFEVLGLENCPVLGSRTALVFELLKFCRSPEKKFWKTFCTGERRKKFYEDLFFLRTLAFVSLASSIPVLGLGFFCVLGLELCVLDSISADNKTRIQKNIKFIDR